MSSLPFKLLLLPALAREIRKITGIRSGRNKVRVPHSFADSVINYLITDIIANDDDNQDGPPKRGATKERFSNNKGETLLRSVVANLNSEAD